MRTPKKLMSTVACPSHASVTALSDHEAGDGLCGAAGTSRPISSTRSIRKLKPHGPIVKAPRPPATLVATKVRRVHSRRFIDSWGGSFWTRRFELYDPGNAFTARRPAPPLVGTVARSRGATTHGAAAVNSP